MTRTNPPRPEHRSIDPYADDVVDVGQTTGATKLVLRCTECRPYDTHPVRYEDDPETVVRCAACGKRHSDNSLKVVDA